MNALIPMPPPSHATIAPNPFLPMRGQFEVAEGETLAAMLDRAFRAGMLTEEELASPFLEVSVHGAIILRAHWHIVRPRNGAQVLVRIRPAGGKGKSPLRMILTLLVVVAVSWISGGGLGALFAKGSEMAALFGAGTTASMVAAGVASVALNALVNAIAPIPQVQQAERKKAQPGYSIAGARNVADPYGPCVLVPGEHRVTPKLAMRYFTTVVADETTLNMLVQWHVGKCTLADIKIGDNALSNYVGVTQQHRLLGQSYASAITLIDHVVIEDGAMQVELTGASGFHTFTSARDTVKISFDITAPSGMYIMNNAALAVKTVDYVMEYRAVGAGSWTGVPTSANATHMISTGNARFALAQDSLVRRTFEWTVSSGQYEVRVRRATGDSTEPHHIDQSFLVSPRSHLNVAPVLDDTICVSAFAVKATDQLSGVIDTLNGVVQSIVPIKSGGNWLTEAATSNPAALWRWLLTGPAIAAAARLTAAGLNTAEVDAWYDYCAANNLKCNTVIDYSASIEEVLQLIASCGYASSVATLGKRSVVIDDEKLPAQLHTAETVRNFRWKKVYLEEVHGLRCNFYNKERGYEQDQVIVYADGYHAGNATKFQEAEIPGKVTYQEAWWSGRRLLKRAQIRSMGYEYEIDAESLTTRYGQRALIEHFALRMASQSARVKALTGASGSITGVTLSEKILFEHGTTYGLQLRRGADGALPVFNLVNPASPGVPVETAIVTFTATALLAVEPALDDLCVFGPLTKICEDASIIHVKPLDDDFSARVTAVPYSADLFADDGAAVPAHLSRVISRLPEPILTPEAPASEQVRQLAATLILVSAAVGDGVLSPSDKRDIVPAIKHLIDTDSTLIDQAAVYGTTTAYTSFVAAMTNLLAYLNTLTTPVNWDNYAGDTYVVAADFETYVKAAMVTQVNLQNALAADGIANVANDTTPLFFNKQANFSGYTGTAALQIPEGWANWLNISGNISRQAGLNSTWAAQIAGVAATDVGIVGQMNDANPVVGPAYMVLEADIVLVSGFLNGAGLYFEWRTAGFTSFLGSAQIDFATARDASNAVPGAGTAGKRYKFTKVFYVPDATAKTGYITAASHWSAFAGGIAGTNSIKWNVAGVRPATAEEIKAYLGLNHDGTLGANTGIFGVDLKESAGVPATNLNYKTSLGTALSYANAGTFATYNLKTPAQLTADIYQSLATNYNPRFSNWDTAGNPPNDWADWAGTSRTRVTGINGAFACQIAGGAGASAGIVNSTMGNGNPLNPGFWVIEADITLNSGALTGAGVFFEWWNASFGAALGSEKLIFSTDLDINRAANGAGTTGRRYMYSKLVHVTHGTTWNALLFAMSHWSGMGSVAGANDITWHECSVRPATQQEITAYLRTTYINDAGRVVDYRGLPSNAPGGVAIARSVAFPLTANNTPAVVVAGHTIYQPGGVDIVVSGQTISSGMFYSTPYGVFYDAVNANCVAYWTLGSSFVAAMRDTTGRYFYIGSINTPDASNTYPTPTAPPAGSGRPGGYTFEY